MNLPIPVTTASRTPASGTPEYSWQLDGLAEAVRKGLAELQNQPGAPRELLAAARDWASAADQSALRGETLEEEAYLGAALTALTQAQLIARGQVSNSNAEKAEAEVSASPTEADTSAADPVVALLQRQQRLYSAVLDLPDPDSQQQVLALLHEFNVAWNETYGAPTLTPPPTHGLLEQLLRDAEEHVKPDALKPSGSARISTDQLPSQVQTLPTALANLTMVRTPYAGPAKPHLTFNERSAKDGLNAHISVIDALPSSVRTLPTRLPAGMNGNISGKPGSIYGFPMSQLQHARLKEQVSDALGISAVATVVTYGVQWAAQLSLEEAVMAGAWRSPGGIAAMIGLSFSQPALAEQLGGSDPQTTPVY